MVTGERLQTIVAEVRGFLVQHADPAEAGRYSRYFREGYDAYGIERHVWEGQLAQWATDYSAELGLDGCLLLGDLLVSSGKYEEGMLTIRLAARSREQITSAALDGLGGWLERLPTWAHCDVLCGEVLGPCLADGSVALADFAGWRPAPGKFRRRAVPVAMLSLLKKPGELAVLLAFIQPMMLDGERVVHQGLGWFLREAWKRTPAPVEAFLLEWKDTSARLIFQYATEKMDAQGKERFRRQRAASKVGRSI